MKAQLIHDELNTPWADRRTRTGHETAQALSQMLHPDNAYDHGDDQAGAVDESLDTLGWIDAVSVNENTGKIFDGHLRVKRALEKDPQAIIPVDYFDLTEEEEALALQVVNATTQMATPNADKLTALMERTKGMVANKPALRGMLDALKARAGVNGQNGPVEDAPPQVDKAAELQEKWQCETGQLWTLGRHRLLIGDCRNPDDVGRLCEGFHVNGVFTSPPYAEQRKKQYGGVPTAEYVEWWEAVQANVRAVLAEGGSFFVNIKEHCEDGQRVLYCKKLLIAMVERWGWRWVDELCWNRVTSPGRWTNRFKNYFEPIYHFSVIASSKFRPRNVLQDFKDDPSEYRVYSRELANTNRPSGFDTIGSMKSPYFDGALPSNVIDANGGHTNGHWATFPLALPTFFIRAYSDPGDRWLDPFAGSGTVIMACENEGRTGLGIEILPKYGAVILQRYHDLTGDEPRLVSG